MKTLFLFFSLLCVFATNSVAAYIAVLETSADGSTKDSVSLSDRQYLTNVLREQAVKELPANQGYTIMTRENIQQMLPPGKAIEDCEGSCLVETGKNIAADYICQARVSRFRNSLTLSAELYETAGSKLIASFNGRGADVEKLLELIEREAHSFFSMVRVMVQPVSSSVVEEKKEETIAMVNEVAENKVVEKIDTVQAVDEPKVILADSTKTEMEKVDTTKTEPEKTDSVKTELAKTEMEKMDATKTESEKTDSTKTELAKTEMEKMDTTKTEPEKTDSAKTELAKVIEKKDVEESKVGESIPANVNTDVVDASAKKSGIHWVPLSISAAATVAGTVLAIVGNSKAKDASEKKYSTEAEYKKYHDDAKTGQTLRSVGFGLAIAGVVGIGLSFAF